MVIIDNSPQSYIFHPDNAVSGHTYSMTPFCATMYFSVMVVCGCRTLFRQLPNFLYLKDYAVRVRYNARDMDKLVLYFWYCIYLHVLNHTQLSGHGSVLCS